MMKAWRLKQVDEDYKMHLQAFLNYQVQGKRKAGKNKTKPVYRTFKDFYNYDAELKKVMREPKKKSDQLAGVRKFLAKKEKKERDNG